MRLNKMPDPVRFIQPYAVCSTEHYETDGGARRVGGIAALGRDGDAPVLVRPTTQILGQDEANKNIGLLVIWNVMSARTKTCHQLTFAHHPIGGGARRDGSNAALCGDGDAPVVSRYPPPRTI